MTTVGIPAPNRMTPERFWATGVRVGPCLVWPGAKDASGYGRVRFRALGGRQKIRVHRAAWILAHGPIPDGLHVCHTCDNPPCFEPLHLFLGTNADNQRDARLKGRQYLVASPGERNGNALLTEDKVREIRRLAATGVSQTELGARYGVHPSAISLVVRRVNWRHVA